MHFPRAVLAASAACALLAGCDIPTEPPLIEQRWIVPVDETTLTVDEVLPTGVSAAGAAFDVSVDPVSTGASLADLCPSCVDSFGFAVPLPAFQDTITSSQSLPSAVVSATVTGGSIRFDVFNGLSFDPTENSGSVTIEFRNGAGGALLGQHVLDTGTGGLPSGLTTTFVMTLSAGTLTGDLVANVIVDAPGGQSTAIDTSEQVNVTATVQSLLVSEVVVNLTNEALDFEAVDLDVEDFDEDITDHIEQGSVVLDVSNPWNVAISGTVTIGSVTKNFSVAGGGQSTVRVDYTGDELRSFLGQPNVQFTGSGTANGTGVSVTPGQEMTVEATLDITIQIG